MTGSGTVFTIIIFYLSIILVMYVYFGYPLLLACIALIKKRSAESTATAYPKVSIIICAFNEEAVIGKTISNKLELDYPSDMVQIIVVSDGSTDKTDEIVKSFSKQGVILIRQSPRQGKTAGLNKAIKEANAEIIVFSDANSIYEKDAVTKLIENFVDPSVGYVTGKMIYVNKNGSVIGDGCSLYMKYENMIRYYESGINSVIGVDGGIDAVRKDLYEEMSHDQLPDFVQPLNILKKGYRVVYEQTAILKEDSLADVNNEYRMRIRVTLRALWSLWEYRELLNPFKYGFTAFQIISHKLLRYFVWVPMCIILASNIILFSLGMFYQVFILFQLILYSLSLTGLLLSSRQNMPNIIYIPFYFVLINLACTVAFIKFLKNEKQIIWSPRSG